MSYAEILEPLRKYIDNQDAKFNYVACPDERRGLIRFKDGRFRFEKHNNNGSHTKLLFILESPHKDEFSNDGSPIGPAQGKTGRNFDAILENVCVLANYHHDIFKEDCYEVWLLNAIQYQISLGLDTEHYRTILFQIIWFNFGKTDLTGRIKNLVKNDDGSVIFNCCTKGSSLNKTNANNLIRATEERIKSLISIDGKNLDLRILVDHAIEDCKLSSKKLRASHPVKWDILINN